MPVRGLVVGIALAKPNEICNFIGCREINKTDISELNGNARFLRELCVDSWIMRNDVNKKMTWTFVNCMPYSILFLLYFDVLTSY